MIQNNLQKCDVNITTNRNRSKTYGSVVYLRDGQKFEIELFNPHKFKVLAKILLNGRYISESGLVLKPGQRVYLERYLDRDESFIFSTYEVENSPEAISAVADNGNIRVDFYSEYVPETVHRQVTWQYFPFPATICYNNTVPPYHQPLCNQTANLTSSANNFTYFSSIPGNPAKESLETGRVERGAATGQNFGTSQDNFSSWVYESVLLKISPISAKPVEIGELRSYCTECGTRLKKPTWKFCPSCGNKF